MLRALHLHAGRSDTRQDTKNPSAINDRSACTIVLRPESKIQGKQAVRIAWIQLKRHVTEESPT